MSGTALVTIATGPKYRRLWEERCRRNWESYASVHGYDVICIDEPLDRSPRAAARSPTWQKCLVLSQPFAERYERIVWVDADLLFNPSAPPVVDTVPIDQVGAVDEFAVPNRTLYLTALRKLYRHWETAGMPFVRNETPAEFHASYGLPSHHDHVVQTGLMVLSPRHHRELLEHVYEYEDRGGVLWGEWRPLSFELQEGAPMHWLDPRFNYPWLVYQAQKAPFLLSDPAHARAPAVAAEALRDVYCLHFAGVQDQIGLVREAAAPERPRRRTPERRSVRTPVAMFVYARPDTTKAVLDAVREARPSRLLVVADAPTPEVEQRAEEVRTLFEEIDWDCELMTNFSEGHMGLNERVVSGLDWIFDNVDEAVVLEDDCVPDPSFFRFCDELLARYRHDERVMTISGSNFDFQPPGDGDSSYRSSRYPLIWGWATWRRAWRRHDPAMRRWPELRESRWLDRLFHDQHAVTYWTHNFDQTHEGAGSWDYAWLFSSWLNDALTLVPRSNLVSNVGFRDDATNTRDNDLSPFADLAAEPLAFPLRHPPDLERDSQADAFLEDILFSGNVRRMFERLRRTRATRGAAVRA